MRTRLIFYVATLTVAFGAAAERYSLITPPDTPEGQYLRLIGMQSTEAERIALLERFTRNHALDPSIPWVWEQLQIAYIEAGQFDKAIAAGERLLEICADDLEAAHRNQEAAQRSGSRELTDCWTESVTAIARKIAASPTPTDPHGREIWKEAASIVEQTRVQDDYSLFRQAASAPSPAEQIRLLDELLARKPDETYLQRMWPLYVHGYRALGDHKRALPYAEKTLAQDGDNEEALLAAAEAHFDARSPKAMPYASKVIQVMQRKPKPPEMSQEEWTNKRADYLASANWIAGATHIGLKQFGDADRLLRQALATFKDRDQRAAPVLFYLGWANYRLSNYSEALKFFERCAEIRSEFQEQAAKNMELLRDERHKQDLIIGN